MNKFIFFYLFISKNMIDKDSKKNTSEKLKETKLLLEIMKNTNIYY